MKLIKRLESEYSSKKLAEALDNVKDFNYFELDTKEIADIIKPIVERNGDIIDVKYTSLQADSELNFEGKKYPTFEFGFVLTNRFGSKNRLVVQICLFGCTYVGLPARSIFGRENRDLWKKHITVELIKWMKSKFGKEYVTTCKKFLKMQKNSCIKALQNNIDELQAQIDRYKEDIEEIKEMYKEDNLGLND